MAYWRMQLHPGDSSRAVRHAVESLANGFIGLDFLNDPGDLSRADQSGVLQSERDFFGFASQMSQGDLVLVIVHHFPFALATVAGPYNYIREPAPELGVWFRHFRRVEPVRYYADHVTDVRKWEQLTMTDTISPLYDQAGKSFRLIDGWK